MKRFELTAFVIVEDETITDATQAQQVAEDALREINKNPDAPHVYLAASEPTTEEDGRTFDPTRDCPHCGAQDALETFLRIDLDGVVLKDGAVVGFEPAGSANDPESGIVVEEANVSCRDCGERVGGAYVPVAVARHWVYLPVPHPEDA